MKMKGVCGILAFGLIVGGVSSAFSPKKDQTQRSLDYKEEGPIAYKIKAKGDSIKVTFRSSLSADAKKPITLTRAVVRLAFDEVQKEYGDSKTVVKIKRKKEQRRIDSIESGAFSGLRSLEAVGIGDVSTIRTHSFEDCPNLETLSIGGDTICTEAEICRACPRLNVLSIGGNGITIGERTFAKTSFEAVNIGGNGICVAGNAFEGCSKLETVSIGGEGITLGERAFAETSVETVQIGGDGITVGAGAFANCLRLKAVSVGCYRIKIDPTAFENCPNLERRPGVENLTLWERRSRTNRGDVFLKSQKHALDL